MTRFPRPLRVPRLQALLTAAVLSLAPAALRAQAPPDLSALAPEAPLPGDASVRIGTLPNGLTYYVRANDRPENRAELRLAVKAGSVLEDDDQLGLAHFVEHMAFNGTERFTGDELRKYLESVGMRFGPGVNAYTSFDETVYQLQIPMDSAEVLDNAFRILADWAQGLRFDAEEIDAERGVIIEEWRGGRGAFARIRDEQFPKVFHGSRYAERLPIGTVGSLEGFEHPSLIRFYRDWYRPDLMAVIAVGDFDVDDIVARIARNFSGMEVPPSPRERTMFEVPDHEQVLVSIASDPELPNASFAVYHKRPVDGRATVADYRRNLIEGLHDRMLRERLNEIRQRPDPPFLGAGAGEGRLGRTKSSFTLSGAAKEDGALTALEAVLTEALRARRLGFTAGELERAKAATLRSMERGWAERENQESRMLVSRYLGHFLDGDPRPDEGTTFALGQRFLPGIGLDEVNAVARTRFTDANRVITLGVPEKEGLAVPTEEEVLAVFERVMAADLEPWAEEEVAEALVASPPAPGRIVSERAIPEVGLTEWTLSNGAVVYLKPTTFKDDEVLFRARSPGGTSLAADDEFFFAVTAGAVVGAGGLGDLDAVQLRKALAGKAASVGPTFATEEEGLSGRASPKDLETLLQLAWLTMTSPRRDSAAFASWKQRVIEGVRNRSASPVAAFSDTLNVVMTQGHPRAALPSVELYETADLDRSLAFYRDRFADAGDFAFFFVGAFDVASMRPLVERWLASLPSSGRQETWRDTGVRPPEGVIKKVVRRGQEEQGRTQIIFTGEMPWTRKASQVISGTTSILEIRLREILREKMGGTYGVSVGGGLDRLPEERYSVSISFAGDPARLEELSGVVFEEIARLRTELPTEEEVATVKEQSRRSRETSLEQNGYWINQLVLFQRYDRDFENILNYEEVIADMTPEDVRDMARATMREGNFVQVTLLPEGGGT